MAEAKREATTLVSVDLDDLVCRRDRAEQLCRVVAITLCKKLGEAGNWRGSQVFDRGVGRNGEMSLR